MKPKIKIALLTDKMDVRPERTAFPREFVENLIKHSEFEVTLVHYKHMSDAPIYIKVREIILPKNRLPWGSHFISYMKFCLTTKEKFDIFMIFVPRPYPFYWFFPAKRIVIKAHDGYVGLWTIPNMVFWFTLTFFNKFLHAVVGVSEFGSREIIYTYHIPPEKIFTIYNPLESVYKPASKEEIKKAFEKYNITTEKYFLHSGSLNRHKNVIRVVKAYMHLRKENPDIEEKLIDKIKEILHATGLEQSPYYADVIFNGNVLTEYRPAFYTSATALVKISFKEGFGMSIAEAMACGSPVIASNISALPEAVGGAGILVNPYDVKEIAEAMKKTATDEKLRKELSKKGFERVKGFTWQNCIDQYINLFKKILYENSNR